jgi:hypothetical protein
VITTLLRYEAGKVMTLLGVPTEDDWTMTAMLALGFRSDAGAWRRTDGRSTK